jgi:hypothetical protein
LSFPAIARTSLGMPVIALIVLDMPAIARIDLHNGNTPPSSLNLGQIVSGFELGVPCKCSPRIAARTGTATACRLRAFSVPADPVKAGPQDEGRYMSPSETAASMKAAEKVAYKAEAIASALRCTSQ